MTDSEIKDQVHNTYSRVRRRLGFTHELTDVEQVKPRVKSEDYGFSQLYLSQVILNKVYGTFEVGLGSFLRIDLIEKHFEPYINDLGISRSDFVIAPTINVSVQRAYPDIISQTYFSNHFLRFESSKAGLDNFEVTIEKLYLERINPYCQELVNIKNLDQIINRQFVFIKEVSDLFVQNIPVFFKRLVIAKYANNPNYEDYCSKTQEIVEKYKLKAYVNKPEMGRYPDVLSNLLIDLSKVRN